MSADDGSQLGSHNRAAPRLTNSEPVTQHPLYGQQSAWSDLVAVRLSSWNGLSDEAGRLPQCFPAEFRQVTRVVDEHRGLDTDGREALFPLLGQRFHGLAE